MRQYQVGEPLQRMAIDIAGPFHPTHDGNQYIIIVMDYFTKWACLKAMPKHDAKVCQNVGEGGVLPSRDTGRSVL
jgi:hypothetical protein